MWLYHPFPLKPWYLQINFHLFTPTYACLFSSINSLQSRMGLFLSIFLVYRTMTGKWIIGIQYT